MYPNYLIHAVLAAAVSGLLILAMSAAKAFLLRLHLKLSNPYRENHS